MFNFSESNLNSFLSETTPAHIELVFTNETTNRIADTAGEGQIHRNIANVIWYKHLGKLKDYKSYQCLLPFNMVTFGFFHFAQMLSKPIVYFDCETMNSTKSEDGSK